MTRAGKPKGEVKPELSLAPVAKRLSELLGKEVVFAKDDNVVGENAKAAVAAMQNGDVVLLENTRYRKEETKNEENFSKPQSALLHSWRNQIRAGIRSGLSDGKGNRIPRQCRK